MSIRLNAYYLICVVLILTAIFSPFIVMKIGPGGYKVYGPDVEDVYIYGGFITGKDRSWDGINFAYKFQLMMILVVLTTTIASYIRRRKGRSSIGLSALSLILVLLFPLWLFLYVSGVQGNSDGAELSTHPHIFGSSIYLIIGGIQLFLFLTAIRDSRKVSKKISLE